MTDDTTSSPSDAPGTRHAKGAARTTIGKLIGDDAAVRKGREEQRRARGNDAARDDDNQREQE